MLRAAKAQHLAACGILEGFHFYSVLASLREAPPFSREFLCINQK
jgi:hypothetical protein